MLAGLCDTLHSELRTSGEWCLRSMVEVCGQKSLTDAGKDGKNKSTELLLGQWRCRVPTLCSICPDGSLRCSLWGAQSARGSGWHDSERCLTPSARSAGTKASPLQLDNPEIAGRRICYCRHHPERMTAISDYYKLKPECKRAFGVAIFPTGEQITMHGAISRTIKRNFRSFLWRVLFFPLLIVEDKELRVVAAIFCFADSNNCGRYENAPRLVMVILSAGVSEADKEKLGHYAPRNLYGSH